MRLELTIRVWDFFEDKTHFIEEFSESMDETRNLTKTMEELGFYNTRIFNTSPGIYEVVVVNWDREGQKVVIGFEVVDTDVIRAIEILQEVKEEWGAKAITNTINSTNLEGEGWRGFSLEKAITPRDVIMNGFNWSNTPEGNNYWNNLYKCLK